MVTTTTRSAAFGGLDALTVSVIRCFVANLADNVHSVWARRFKIASSVVVVRDGPSTGAARLVPQPRPEPNHLDSPERPAPTEPGLPGPRVAKGFVMTK